MAQRKTAKTRDGAMYREEIVNRLTWMRHGIEAEMRFNGGPAVLSREQQALLDDVCRAFGLDDEDVDRVVLGRLPGFTYPSHIYPAVPFPAAFIQEARDGEG